MSLMKKSLFSTSHPTVCVSDADDWWLVFQNRSLLQLSTVLWLQKHRTKASTWPETVKALSHLLQQTWVHLPAGIVQLKWHQAYWKDATPGWCKQRRSWRIRKHPYPISQTYRTCNALLKLAKDTCLGVRNKGSRRKHILTAIEECQKMHSHRLQVQCLGLHGAGSEHRRLTGELGHRGCECNFSAPAGFQPWLQPCGSLAKVTQEFGKHMNFCSAQGSWETCPPLDAWLKLS